jgi:hypothetical protein
MNGARSGSISRYGSEAVSFKPIQSLLSGSAQAVEPDEPGPGTRRGAVGLFKPNVVPAPGRVSGPRFPECSAPPFTPEGPVAMSLSVKLAREVNQVVVNDAACRKQIESLLSYLFPDAAGATGTIRNVPLWIFSMIANVSSEDPRIKPWVCHGIADVTVEAINKVYLGKKKMPVKYALTINRSSPMEHYATNIFLADKSNYVFDWHATLNVSNPKVHTTQSWLEARSGIQLAKFKGFAK